MCEHLDALELRIVDESWELPMREFFDTLCNSNDDPRFRWYPATDEEIHRCIEESHESKNIHYILVNRTKVLGYGRLRGWDNGYEIPNLGIVIHPDVRGVGLGKALMNFLHLAARQRGAKKIRLKVHLDNVVALSLYETLGYSFGERESGQVVGFLDL